MIRRILMASTSFTAFIAPAAAAEPTPATPAPAPPPSPPAAVFSWTGLYVGGQIGYAWGNENTSLVDNFGDYFNFGYNTSGVIGGAHVGYNLQLQQWVLGVEGDVDGTSVNKSLSTPIALNAGTDPGFVNFSASQNVQGSIRGRIGYAWDRIMLYATGGVALTGLNGGVCGNFIAIDGVTPYGGCASASTTRVGYTVGGGLEYAVTDNWSIRAEYRYSDFGLWTQFANSWNEPFLGAVGNVVGRHLLENRVQVGFSYKFEMAPPAPVVAKY